MLKGVRFLFKSCSFFNVICVFQQHYSMGIKTAPYTNTLHIISQFVYLYIVFENFLNCSIL